MELHTPPHFADSYGNAASDQHTTPLPVPVPPLPVAVLASDIPLHSTYLSEASSSLCQGQLPDSLPGHGPSARRPSFSVPHLSLSPPPMPPASIPLLSSHPPPSPLDNNSSLPDATPSETLPVSDCPIPPRLIPNDPTPTTHTLISVPYPLAIHLAILVTLCPTLSAVPMAPPTSSPDLCITPPAFTPPTCSNPPGPAAFVPSVLACLTSHLPIPPTLLNTTRLVLNTCSPAWDATRLAHDPDVGVLASCVDLVSLNVLEPAKSQHDDPQGTPWHVVPETVGEYWAYLVRSVTDAALLVQLTKSFSEYLDRRDKLADAQAKHQALLTALGPDTSELHAQDALKNHIHHLHVYNEYQDLAQSIMGRLADMDGVTVKHVYESLGIDMDSDRVKKAA